MHLYIYVYFHFMAQNQKKAFDDYNNDDDGEDNYDDMKMRKRTVLLILT